MRCKKSLQPGKQTYRIMPAVFRYRMLILFFVLLVAAGVFCGSVAAYDDIQYAQNLSDALNISITGAAYANGNTVYLLKDVPLNYTINITAASPITLTTAGNDHTIFRNVSNVYLFKISSGTIILAGNGYNLTIDGNKATYDNTSGYCLIYVNGGIFTMDAGSVLQNSTTSGFGGGVFVDDGMFNMTGGNISNNNADESGGGVYVNSGTFNMTGGTIVGNSAAYGGGGLCVRGGESNMTGGTISENSVTIGNGGGVYLEGGTFTLTDGTISGNNATLGGGGVYGGGVVNDAIFTMNGGNISRNNATDGGGMYVGEDDTFSMTFTMTGGNISGNNAIFGGGIFADEENTFINISGSAKVDADNDVYLNSSQFITVTGVLSLDAGARNITPGYTSGTVIRYNDGVSLGTWTSNFALNQTWANEHPQLTLERSGNDILLGTSPTATPTSSEGGGNDGNNADYGSTSPDGTFTTNDGGLTLHYPAGSSVIVTVFPNDLGGATAPSGTSYLTVYDVHSTAVTGTSVTLVFRIAASELEEKNLTSNDIAILHYYDGEWHQMTIKSIELVDGVYQFTVTSTHTSPFMVAYNADRSSFPLEEASTPTSTPTTGSTEIVPTSTTPTQTEAASSPVPLVGIIAGLGAAGLLMRRE